jgi:hypothetical protein
VTALELLRDALARIVYLRESFEVGEVDTAVAIAADLERDLAAGLAELERRAA